MSVGAEENVVRAICSPDKYDPETGKISPSLFKGSNTSVSRLALLTLEDHWELFRVRVQKPSERLLELIGEINVGRLQEIGMTHPDRPIALTVEPAPEEWPAHAVIPQKISTGLANRIIAALIRHKPPE